MTRPLAGVLRDPITVALAFGFAAVTVNAEAIGLPNRAFVVILTALAVVAVVVFPTEGLRSNQSLFLLALGAGWTALFGPLGLAPANDTALGIYSFALLMVGAILVERVDFEQIMVAYLLSLSVIVGVSVLLGNRAANGRVEGLFAGANDLGSHGSLAVTLGLSLIHI